MRRLPLLPDRRHSDQDGLRRPGAQFFVLPPSFLVAMRMEIAMVERAEGYGELVGYLPAHGAGLGKAEVMGF